MEDLLFYHSFKTKKKNLNKRKRKKSSSCEAAGSPDADPSDWARLGEEAALWSLVRFSPFGVHPPLGGTHACKSDDSANPVQVR